MSQVYRAYYAIRGLANSRGVPTNATYGFALMLNRLLEEFPPEYIAMVFDSTEPTDRHIQYPLYKATREKMPTDLGQQIPYIRRFCGAMRVPMIEVRGQEADDVIGTIARRAREDSLYPVIVTMDKDLMQLVGEILCPQHVGRRPADRSRASEGAVRSHPRTDPGPSGTVGRFLRQRSRRAGHRRERGKGVDPSASGRSKQVWSVPMR